MKKIKNNLYLILVTILLQSTVIFGQNIEWAKKVATANQNSPKIAVDKLGNSFVFGNFTDSCTFGNLTITTTIGNDAIYLAKYDPFGVVQWLNKIDGISETAQDISIDRIGNVYLTGIFQGTTNFSGANLLGGGSYIAKYSTSGAIIWVHTIDTLQGTYANRIVVSDSGNIFVSGAIISQANFGCAILNKGIYDTQFIVRYDSSGNCQWAETFTAKYVYDLSVDKKNCVYLTGAIIGQGAFGTYSITSNGSQDIYFAKCNADGTWAWAISSGSTDCDNGLGVTVDNYGHIYFTGFFTHTATFGSTTLTSIGANDIFIACYNESGNFLWVKQAGGGYGSHYGFAITSDRMGNCIITGSIIDTTHFGNYTIVPNGEKTFIAKYDSLGICKWAITSSGDSGDRGLDLKTDTLDNIFLTGQFFSYGNYGLGSYSFNVPYSQITGYNFDANTNIYIVKINSSLVNVLELKDNIVKLYPNPTSSVINIVDEQNQLLNSTIDITNYLGQHILSIPFSNNIDVIGFPSGVYTINIKTSNGATYRSKFIKE